MTITELPTVVDQPGTIQGITSQPETTPAYLSDVALCSTGTSGLTRLFFSEDLGDIAHAKAICASCPMLVECLEGAIEREEPWGVWGGQLFRNGRILSSKRPRGRPPKNPQPQHIFEPVPLPEHLRDRLLTA